MPIPFWLKIVGPLAALALLIGGLAAWGHSKYKAGHQAGVAETDRKWQDASEKLKAQALKTASKADDAAIVRLEQHVQHVDQEKAAVAKAAEEGRSPLDVLFN